MKISLDRNVVFDDQPAPLTFDEAQKSVEQRKPLAAPPTDALVLIDLGVGVAREPDIRLVRQDKAGRGSTRVQVELPQAKLGQHAFRPPIETTGFDPLSKEAGGKTEPLVADRWLPV